MGANDFMAFRRVYFPQSIPGIGAGSILVFILRNWAITSHLKLLVVQRVYSFQIG
jgi:ABC-type spermidine/putrescine transport system permease subunit I